MLVFAGAKILLEMQQVLFAAKECEEYISWSEVPLGMKEGLINDAQFDIDYLNVWGTPKDLFRNVSFKGLLKDSSGYVYQRYKVINIGFR